MVANMVTGREASPQDAHSFLSKVFQSTDQHLDAFQQLSAFFEGVVKQQGDWAQASRADHSVSRIVLEALLLPHFWQEECMHNL